MFAIICNYVFFSFFFLRCHHIICLHKKRLSYLAQYSKKVILDDNALIFIFSKNQLWPTEKKGKNKNNKNDFFYFQNMETLENKNVVKVVNGFMSVNLWPVSLLKINILLYLSTAKYHRKLNGNKQSLIFRKSR